MSLCFNEEMLHGFKCAENYDFLEKLSIENRTLKVLQRKTKVFIIKLHSVSVIYFVKPYGIDAKGHRMDRIRLSFGPGADR